MTASIAALVVGLVLLAATVAAAIVILAEGEPVFLIVAVFFGGLGIGILFIGLDGLRRTEDQRL